METKPLSKEKAKRGSSTIGLEEKDLANYSLRKAIFANGEGKLRELAPLEYEASEAVGKSMGRSARGILVPAEVLKRDLTVGNAASAGDLVQTSLMSMNMIELLRNSARTIGLGATVLSGLRDNIDIPRQTGGSTPQWIPEGNTAPEEDQTVDQVSMSPNTLAVFTEYTRKLMIQASVDIEAWIRMDLMTGIALELDRAVINGSGAGAEPLGILNTPGIGDVSFGTPNGGVPSWAGVVDLETKVAVQNAATGRLAYLTNSDVRGKLKTTEKATNTAQFIWPDPLVVPSTPGDGIVNGYPCAVSNQVPNNLVEGASGATLSAIIFGNWADVLIGEWGTVDIVTNQFSKLTSGVIQVVAFSEYDINLRHPESFSAAQDAITV